MPRLLIIDTETGGTDPGEHSLLSLGAVVWDEGRLGAEFEVLVAEPHIVVTTRAMEINGINLVQHRRRALSPEQAMAAFEAFVADHFAAELAANDRVVLAGHNVAFDVGFLKRLCRLSGASFDAIFSHRTLDTASVLRFLALADLLPETAVGSSEAFTHLKIPISARERHTALGDARATGLLLTQLIGLVSPAAIRAFAAA